MNAATPRRAKIQIGQKACTISGTLLSARRANHPVPGQLRIRDDGCRDYRPVQAKEGRGGRNNASFARLHRCGYAANSKMTLPLRWPRAACETAVFASPNGYAFST